MFLRFNLQFPLINPQVSGSHGVNVLKPVAQEPNSQPENVMKTNKAQTPAMEIIKKMLEAWIDI